MNWPWQQKKANPKRIIIYCLNLILLFIILYFMVGRSLFSQEPTDLASFALTAFAGYLFFLLIPVELMFIFYASTEQPNMVMLVLLTVALAMTAQSLDYFIGSWANKNFLKNLIGTHKFKTFKKFLGKYGYVIIFLFNLFPLSSPLLILMAGMLNYPFWPVFTIGLSGLLIKYSFISLFYL